MRGFRRTFVGLKGIVVVVLLAANDGFRRTFVGLKGLWGCVYEISMRFQTNLCGIEGYPALRAAGGWPSFRRTFVGLKASESRVGCHVQRFRRTFVGLKGRLNGMVEHPLGVFQTNLCGIEGTS